jgi:cellulose synthase/poly-beta-1,6-N-acetylglucosamine synthase-like glycosyltransferase
VIDLIVALLFTPVLIVTIDTFTQMRSRVTEISYFPVTSDTAPCTDYTIIVPIYGSIQYLENVAYLRQYGPRVLLTTSQGETEDFYTELRRIAREHNFRTHISSRLATARERGTPLRKGRATEGTVRDTIVLDAHDSITSSYVVCIDADTVTDVSLDYLVGTLKEADLDIASVMLTAANRDTLLARLQGHEYRMAMRIRRIMPWMISGGCHVARREVHRDLMRRHSLFFQGNDVELGLLADLCEYRIGHIPFVVPTTVPSHFLGWFRQRRAWAGGEFRLFLVNLHLSLRHPFLYLYGGIIVILLLPARWYSLFHPTLALLAAMGFYLVSIVAINWKTRDASLLIYPLYSLFYTLVMVPIGVVAYGAMAFKYKNFGVIRARRAGSGGVTTWASGEGGIPNVHVGVECSPPQRSWLRPQARADGGDNSFDLAHGLTEIGGESRDVSVGVECSPPQRSWRRA